MTGSLLLLMNGWLAVRNTITSLVLVMAMATKMSITEDKKIGRSKIALIHAFGT